MRYIPAISLLFLIKKFLLRKIKYFLDLANLTFAKYTKYDEKLFHEAQYTLFSSAFGLQNRRRKKNI